MWRTLAVFLGTMLRWKKADAQMIPFAYWQTIGFSVWGIGLNYVGDGVLGIGDYTTNAFSSPVQVGAMTNWSLVSPGSLHALAVKTDHTLWAWGDNTNGNLGLGTRASKSSPVQVGALKNWATASSGGMYTTVEQYYSMAVKTDGTLWGWGDNTSGQLGDGTVVAKSSPVQIGTLTNWATVTTGWNFHTIAVKTDGTLWTWGDNTYGQLGDGTTIAARSSPVQVGALTNWSKVKASESHVLALKTDGTLWAWGGNGSGQLGINNTTSKSSPVQVGALATWSQIGAGGASSGALRTDGSLWMWGAGSEGEIANGGSVDKTSPIQVGAGTSWNWVSVGYTHVAAVKSDGTLWAWGDNTEGQLGDGTVTSRSSPVQVGALTNWRRVAAGESFTMGLK